MLGRRVFKLLQQYQDTASFYAPDDALADAAKHLSPILNKKGMDWRDGEAVLDVLPTPVGKATILLAISSSSVAVAVI